MDQKVIDRLKDYRLQRKQNLQYLKQLNQEAIKKKLLKKLTILHSNDLHGDFLAAETDSELVGGVSMLSGYINKVRIEEKMLSTRSRATCFGDRSLTVNVLEEYLVTHDFSQIDNEPRLVIHT